MLQAEKDVPGIMTEWRDFIKAEPNPPEPLIKAIGFLQNWDFRSADGSEATSLYVLWWEQIRQWQRAEQDVDFCQCRRF